MSNSINPIDEETNPLTIRIYELLSERDAKHRNANKEKPDAILPHFNADDEFAEEILKLLANKTAEAILQEANTYHLHQEMVWRYRAWAKNHGLRPTLKNYEEWLRYMESANE